MKLFEIIRNYWKVLITVTVMVVIAIVFLKKGPPEQEQPAAHIEQMTLPVNAVIHQVQSKPAASIVPVVGTVMSEETVNLSARIPATVSKVLAVTGKKVSRGETLVILDDREIREQVSAAEAQFKQADSEYQRAKKLMDARATTQQAMEMAESMVNAAKAQLDRAKVMMSYTVITSPMDGIVTERKVEAGDLASPGQMLASIYDPSHMRLECPVPVRLVDKLSPGKLMEVVLDRPAKTFKGKVSEIVGEVDAITRTQKIKISLEGTGSDVLPGSFGRLYIEDDPVESIFIPVTAVYRTGQLEIVQAVDGNSVIKRMVKTGVVLDGQVEILAGLKNGEKILVNPVKGD
ncbi:MAG: efflux RND transporter periplasmic adaptor subunit [Kiritimatiellae bacterium]|nr:efflux RND transporter periplasmic adaptor subunit [Kiritimatiellia bacterium]MDD5522467.1 efflux RND transporter periplasmic adaptor subunit [Kiritimatiellia bacterium]